jgi:glutaredoxin
MIHKKKSLGLLALILAILIIVLLFVFVKFPKNGGVLLKDGAVLNETICKQIDNITVIHRAGCVHCAAVLPRLRELEQELNMSFTYYDIAISQDNGKVVSLNLIPEGVPTVIINCKVYVGERSKDDYKSAILG